jgi:microcystin-dependent protein
MLPNLQGILPIGQGQGPGLTSRSIGQVGGSASVTLTTSTMAQHNHPYMATTAPATSQTFPTMASAAAPASQYFYTSTTVGATAGTFPANAVGFVGGGQPHENRMPSLCVTYIIALFGIFPSRN